MAFDLEGEKICRFTTRNVEKGGRAGRGATKTIRMPEFKALDSDADAS